MKIRYSGSVIIPFSGIEYAQLSEQLDALSRQDTLEEFEIILCLNRDSLHPTILEQLKKCAYPKPFRVFLANKVTGPSHARNVGVSLARSEKLLFCDSDDVVSTSWVSSMLKALENHDLVGGPLIYFGEERSRHGMVSFQNSQRTFVTKFNFLPFANSSNLGIQRNCFASLEGFNENFTTGEDTEFCWRAQLAGFSLHFDASAYVFYRLRQNFKEAYIQFQSYALGDMKIAQAFNLQFRSYMYICSRFFRMLLILGMSPLAFISGKFRRTLGCNLGYISGVLKYFSRRSRESNKLLTIQPI